MTASIGGDRKGAVERAISSCLAFVLARQSAEGNWTEWALPPGASAPWTTAYVGYAIRLLPPKLDSVVAGARQRAAAWLAKAEFPGGGWGYNAVVGADADSTAYGILFLSSVGRAVPEACYRRLAQFQRPDGGFATYDGNASGDSWAASHPDVTPVAVLALMTRQGQIGDAVSRGVAYVRAHRTDCGLWQSFWWRTPWYATYACLALLREVGERVDLPAGREGLTAGEPPGAFTAALRLACLLRAGGERACSEVLALVDGLLAVQLRDGSWPTEPILRITRRDCFGPWAIDDAGPLFADPGGLFTSSTVLGALSMAHAAL